MPIGTSFPVFLLKKIRICKRHKHTRYTRENQSKLEAEMLNLCKQLPEYETVMAMYGVGKSTGPHLMAELGDVRRFPHHSSIVAFAGVDPGIVGSGKMQLSSVDHLN